MKAKKIEQPLLTLKKSAKSLEREDQPKQEGPSELNVLDTSICGCDFGDPCCPEDQ